MLDKYREEQAMFWFHTTGACLISSCQSAMHTGFVGLEKMSPICGPKNRQNTL